MTTTDTTIARLTEYRDQLRRELTPTKQKVNPQGYADRLRELEAVEFRLRLLTGQAPQA